LYEIAKPKSQNPRYVVIDYVSKHQIKWTFNKLKEFGVVVTCKFIVNNLITILLFFNHIHYYFIIVLWSIWFHRLKKWYENIILTCNFSCSILCYVFFFFKFILFFYLFYLLHVYLFKHFICALLVVDFVVFIVM